MTRLPLSPLERLPPELLYHLVSFLPSSSTSICPRTTLSSLSLTSHHLYSLLAPSIDERVELRTEQQVERFLDAVERGHLRGSLKSVKLLVPPRHKGHDKGWNLHVLRRILDLTRGDVSTELRELCWAGVSVSSVFEAIVDYAAEETQTMEDVSGILTTLKIDFLKGGEEDITSFTATTSSTPSPTLTDTKQLSPSQKRICDPSDATTRHQQLFSLILETWPHLETLSISNLPESRPSPTSSRSTSPSPSHFHIIDSPLPPLHLTTLALNDSHISYSTLHTLLSRSSKSLQTLEISNSRGFSSEDLVDAITPCTRITRLSLSFEGTTLNGSTKCLPALYSSPTKKGSSKSTKSQNSVLDKILPHLPHLTHLSVNGGKLYSSSLGTTLSSFSSNLISLSISLSSSFTLNPISLLPLIKSSSSLRLLEINNGWKDTSMHEQIRELWGAAVDRDIMVEGDVWDQSVAKWVEWASEGIEEVVNVPVKSVRKRPKRRVATLLN